mgnify:FL=1
MARGDRKGIGKSCNDHSRQLNAVEPEGNRPLHPQNLCVLEAEPGSLSCLIIRRVSVEIRACSDFSVFKDMVFVPFMYVKAATKVIKNLFVILYALPKFKFSAVSVEAVMQIAAE